MKNLLITGGTGTFGQEIIRNLLDKDLYKKIVVYSRDEYKQFKMKTNLQKEYGVLANKVRYIIGDIKDYTQLLISLKDIDAVIHTASLKHIDVCEYNPAECIKTIINGTMNVCNASIERKVKKVLFLSTDKSCAPVNIYGSCKMTAEKYTIFSNSFSNGTNLSVCRWGNIVGSRGSLIQTLLSQSNNVVNITDAKMTRFFLNVKDAVNLCLYSLNNLIGGEVFVLESKAINIEKLAKMIVPNAEINYIGIRAGEKIHERLINESEINRLAKTTFNNKNYYIVLPEIAFWGEKYNNYKKNKINEPEEKFISSTAEQFTDEELYTLIEEEKARIK